MDNDSFYLIRSKIAIVGLGLMGGSLALALKGKCAAIYGIDPQRESLELARRQNIVDLVDSDPAILLPKADIIILAAPVPAILTMLDHLPGLTPNRSIVIDLGSTKRLIVEAMRRLPERFDPIGGHPICGKEKLSLLNADRTLYSSAPFLLTPLERTTPRAMAAASQIIEAIGAHSTCIDATDHDRILASTSALPFLVSSALALATPDEVIPFIGPGFKSTSRLAGTASTMMLGVLQSNRENVLEALRRMRTALDEMENALSTDDSNHLLAILDQAQASYQSLNRAVLPAS